MIPRRMSWTIPSARNGLRRSSRNTIRLRFREIGADIRMVAEVGSGSGLLTARENLMSHARKLSPEWEFVVAVIAAIILAAAGGATIFSFVHRPAAALHPPVAESVATPTLAAPEVSRPITADTGRGAAADGSTGG
jgi:hypothetical protein